MGCEYAALIPFVLRGDSLDNDSAGAIAEQGPRLQVVRIDDTRVGVGADHETGIETGRAQHRDEKRRCGRLAVRTGDGDGAAMRYRRAADVARSNFYNDKAVRLYERADAQLYAAKSAGRNCVR